MPSQINPARSAQADPLRNYGRESTDEFLDELDSPRLRRHYVRLIQSRAMGGEIGELPLSTLKQIYELMNQ